MTEQSHNLTVDQSLDSIGGATAEPHSLLDTLAHSAGTVHDTLMNHLHAADHAEHHSEEIGDVLVHHLTDIHTISLPGIDIPLHSLQFSLFGIDMSITKPVIFMWLGGLLLLLIFGLSFRGGKLLGSRLAAILEVYILFIRDEVVYPTIGEKDGRKMMPFFLTVFFFILTANLLGLVPWGYSATMNVNVTAGLAVIAFFTIQGAGIVKLGLGGWLKSIVPSGLPAFVLPVMIPVEIVGMLAKPFALCIRLFANMLAGHAVVLVLLLLIIEAGNYLVAPAPLFGVLFIMSLELFVAHLQAFIFTILTALFASMTMHPSH